MSSGKCCTCEKPDTASGTATAQGYVVSCPNKSKGPHAVPRKKYKANDLNTAGFQCNYELNDDLTANIHGTVQAIDIQCDIDPEDDDANHVCSPCTCTLGFCNARCEAAKQKMGRNRSDSWQSPKASGIPVPIKHNSVPGLASLVTEPKSSCKCVGRCTRECEKQKLAQAMAAIKKGNGVSKCAENQCRSACNINLQTDMEEPPIAPIAPPDVLNNADSNAQPQSEASNVCIACQCNGPCSIECNIKKHGIAQLITAEDMMVSQIDTCLKCECTGECNPICREAKKKKGSMKSVCDICECRGPCSPECTKAKEDKSKENQTDKPGPTKNSETMCEMCCAAESQTSRVKIVPKVSQGVVCTICECVGTCTEACQSKINATLAKEKQTAPSEAATAAANMSKPICENCVCPAECNNECQAIKMARRICDECVCNATCTPQCEEKKREKNKKICEICNCCGKCFSECEKQKIANANKQLVNTEDQTPSKHSKTTEDTTQLNGLIEDFNDDQLVANVDKNPLNTNPKAISACNVDGEVVCEDCQCTETCNSKCAAVRKIRSVAEFPPSTMVCDECKCIETCTKPCDLKKSKLTCATASSQPIKCNDDNSDWIPCVSCKDNIPCSPECRERMAHAYVMPKAAEPTTADPNNIPQSTTVPEGVQTQEIPKETCATPVQTCASPVVCTDIQTVTCDADINPVVKATSTANGIVSPSDFNKENANEECGPSASCAKQVEPPLNPPCDNETTTLLDGTGETCLMELTAQGQECGMCLKLRRYLCSMFHEETGDQSRDDKSKKPKNDCLNSTKSEKNIKCPCMMQSKPKKKEKPQSDVHDRRCTCSRSLGQKKSSYTERMQMTMGHLRASCEDAELAASPYIKAASVFALDVNNQQEAIMTLLQKCRQKDHYIDALIEDVLDRSKSKVFDSLIGRLKEQNLGAPDFDGALITCALDKNKKNAPVCGIDLTGFNVCSVKRVGATSLLIKWSAPVDRRVCGYDINVNGQLKSRIGHKERLYAILDALDFTATISIEIYAIASNGRAYPPVLAYYAKY